MITKMSHFTIYVLDQDQAYDFYVNKLGFEVGTDAKMDNGFRWLTVRPKGTDQEIILMAVNPGQMFDEETSNQIKALIRKGKMGSGVFETNDCKATYAELKAKGVEFMQEPKEQFYGIEALFKDNSGNWFSLSEHPKQ
ncbi:MAG: VOC family protein [Bacteroidia bacterium]|nr:VOC family protein [Bacteroidia bacterium]